MEKLTAHTRDGKLEIARVPRLLIGKLKLIGTITGAVTITAALCLIIQSNYYISKGTLLPTGDQSSNVLGSLAAAVPGLDLMPREQEPTASSQLFPDILESRVIREQVLATSIPERLRDELEVGTIGEALGESEPERMDRLSDITDISKDKKTGVISLSVEYSDPRLAQTIAAAYIDNLEKYCSSERFARLNQNRSFIAGRLNDAEDRLRRAEDTLLSFREQNRNYYNSSAPDLQLEHERLVREVEKLGNIYAVLSEQLELATLEAERKKPIVAVLDYPAVPLVKSGPTRLLTTLQFALGALLLSCFGIIFSDYLRQQIPSREIEEFSRWQANVEEQISGFRKRLRLVRKESVP